MSPVPIQIVYKKITAPMYVRTCVCLYVMKHCPFVPCIDVRGSEKINACTHTHISTHVQHGCDSLLAPWSIAKKTICTSMTSQDPNSAHQQTWQPRKIKVRKSTQSDQTLSAKLDSKSPQNKLDSMYSLPKRG